MVENDQTTSKELPINGHKRIVSWLQKFMILVGTMAALSGVVGGAYAAAYFGKILPGVKVAGIEVGNMTAEVAANLIEKRVGEKLKTIKVISTDEVFEVKPEDIDLIVDLPATLNEAWLVGRKGGVLERLGQAQTSFFNGKNIPLIIKVDNEKFDLILGQISSRLDQDEIMPAVTLKNKGSEKIIEINKGKNGLRVEKETLKNSLTTKWSLLQGEDQQLPLKRIEVEVNDETEEIIRKAAERLIGKELIIKLDEETWSFKDQELIGLLRMTKEAGFDEEKIKLAVAQFAEGVNKEPQNAAFRFENGKVEEFRPGKDGVEVIEEDLIKQIKDTYSSLTEKDKVELNVAVVRTPPKIKTEEVNNLGIKELLGKGESTYFHSIPNRVHNVSLAASRVAGTLVAPGDEFSFNQVVGEISAKTGYKTAYVISGGRTILGDGGGVCQVSTTLFRAALKAGLPVTERKAHAYRVGYYEQDSPPGIDATVYSPTADFKFKNDTSAYILVQPIINTEKFYLSFEIYGTSDGRKSEVSQVKIWGQSPPLPTLYQDDPTLPVGTLKQVDWSAPGAKTSFDYKVTRNGETIFSKTFYSVYRPWQAVYLRGTKTN